MAVVPPASAFVGVEVFGPTACGLCENCGVRIIGVAGDENAFL